MIYFVFKVFTKLFSQVTLLNTNFKHKWCHRYVYCHRCICQNIYFKMYKVGINDSKISTMQVKFTCLQKHLSV